MDVKEKKSTSKRDTTHEQKKKSKHQSESNENVLTNV